jgi:cyanophycinase
VLASGGLVVGVGASASGMCDPMVDPRGGAFTLGLGLVTGLAVVSQVDQWSAERLRRTLDMADTTVACIPTGAALVRRSGVWETVGEVEVHGTMP